MKRSDASLGADAVMRFWRGQSMQDVARSLGLSKRQVEEMVRAFMRARARGEP